MLKADQTLNTRAERFRLIRTQTYSEISMSTFEQDKESSTFILSEMNRSQALEIKSKVVFKSFVKQRFVCFADEKKTTYGQKMVNNTKQLVTKFFDNFFFQYRSILALIYTLKV